MPKLTQSVFAVYRLMFYNFLRVFKHILLDSPGFGVKVCSLGIFKRTKVLWFKKEERKRGYGKERGRRGQRVRRNKFALLLSFSCFHSLKWGLIIFNRENVAIEQFKIDLLKLTDYSNLYHKRMHPHTLQAFLQETWGYERLPRMLSI